MKAFPLHAAEVDKEELKKLSEFVATLPKESALRNLMTQAFETLEADLPVVLYTFGTKK